ncbi:MAG: hypothetical protein ABIS68_07980, partial [Casimicrobiaceae bacterium]
QESRELKALSASEVSALLAGKGMGLAKSAELNGYPGPAHVLELKSELQLSADQQMRTEALFQAMEAKASALGRRLVTEERSLEEMFASGGATESGLATATAKIGAVQGELRGVHLAAHIEQTRILTREQIMRYATLRGYDRTTAPTSSHSHNH